MRIIAGQYKGRRLFTPEGKDVRPTSDRTREALFNLLMHGSYGGQQVIGRTVADICCGTGALGLESLSRGAASCLFIDSAAPSLALAKRNADHLGAREQSRFLQCDASALGTAPTPCALVMIDAPYHAAFLPRTLAALARQGWLEPNALVCVEQEKNEPVHEITGLSLCDRRDYGKASLRLYRPI